MNGHNFRIASCAILVLAIWAAPADAQAPTDSWGKQYSISGRANVRIDTNDANVTITTWDRKEVDFRVITEGWKIGDNDVRVASSQSGANNVELTVRVPEFRWTFRSNNKRSVRITVSMPREADLDAHTGDGYIMLDDLNGKVNLRSGDGLIRMRNVRGDMQVRTGDGMIEGDGLDGHLDADTGDGRIHVTGRFETLALRTGDGAIEAEVEKGSKMARSWSLETNDGSIRLQVPRDLNADVDARTGDGRIRMGMPVTVTEGVSESRVRGRLNAGGQLLRLRSGDGSITINP